MSIKQKLKNFFKSNESSDVAVEILRMYILPFAKMFRGRGTSVDDVLSAFFGTEDRVFVTLKANRDFKLPGKYFVTGNRPVYGLGPRNIKKDTRVLMAMDKPTNTARVAVFLDGKEHDFMLEKFELEAIKDNFDVVK